MIFFRIKRRKRWHAGISIEARFYGIGIMWDTDTPWTYKQYHSFHLKLIFIHIWFMYESPASRKKNR